MASLIFKSIGPGSREKTYQNALEQYLHDEGIVAISEKTVPIYFRDQPVGVGFADIVVQNRLVLELKATSGNIQVSHIHQCMQYVRASGIPCGLVINFPQHHARDVEVYDCTLGIGLAPGKVDDEDKARAGDFGPSPPVVPKNILSYEDYQYAQETRFVQGEKTAAAEPPEKKAKVQVETTSGGNTKTSFFLD